MDSQHLTPELIEKARACKTSEELSALAEEVGAKLSDDELDGLSGGSWATECPKEDCSDYTSPTGKPEGCDRFSCYNDGMF